MAFDNLLHQLRTTALHTRDQGDRLERLTKEFLTKDSIQSRLYKKVYLWKDWDGRENFGDIGIDLVAENVDGGVTAIQCKFYDEHSTIAKEHIDSFISASGRKPFTHRIIVSTTDKWSKNAEKMLEEQRFPVQRMGPVSYTHLLHDALEGLAVLAEVDGVNVRANQLDVVLLEDAALAQLDGRVQSGLAAQGRQDGVGLFLRDNLLDHLGGDGLNVGGCLLYTSRCV